MRSDHINTSLCPLPTHQKGRAEKRANVPSQQQLLTSPLSLKSSTMKPVNCVLVPSAALARVDANSAVQCQDGRDFYGCVRVFTTPAQHSDDTAPLPGVVGQLAVGLISSTRDLIAPTNVSRSMTQLVLLKGSCGAACAEPKQAPITCGSSPGTDRRCW